MVTVVEITRILFKTHFIQLIQVNIFYFIELKHLELNFKNNAIDEVCNLKQERG